VYKNRLFIKVCFIVLITLADLSSVTLDQVTNILGVRDNQLIGYGLIIGLSGSGDSSSAFTNQTLTNILQGVNVKVSANSIKSKNIAAVIVTATLPAFIKQGDKIDIKVSSIGDAKSLRGGTLIMTPLKGIDGDIYAIAQGSLDIAQPYANAPTTIATVPRGAIVEKEVQTSLSSSQKMTMTLKHSNFTNAINVQLAINNHFKKSIAKAIDSRTLKLTKPFGISSVEFIASLEKIKVDYKMLDKIVINSISGTIIAGLDVEVEPVIVTHKDITVQIEPTFVLVPSKRNIGDGVSVNKEENIITTTRRPTVANIARALQRMGATPKDMISILLSMRKAGAIVVDIEVI
jgi:flagellar P-ring protein precursor FlgI